MSGVLYYSDGFIEVTGEYAKFGGRAYSLSDVNSVKVWSAPTEPFRELPYFLIVAGSLTTFGLLNIRPSVQEDWESTVAMLFLLGVAIGLVGLAVLVIQMLWKTRCVYAVMLGGKFGTAVPYASDDERYVRRIATAIHLALRASPASVASTEDTTAYQPMDA
jgi:hypothetical protein